MVDREQVREVAEAFRAAVREVVLEMAENGELPSQGAAGAEFTVTEDKLAPAVRAKLGAGITAEEVDARIAAAIS